MARVHRTRTQMIHYIVSYAARYAGIDTTSPLYLQAQREIQGHTDDELLVLIDGIETGDIHTAAAREIAAQETAE